MHDQSHPAATREGESLPSLTRHSNALSTPPRREERLPRVKLRNPCKVSSAKRPLGPRSGQESPTLGAGVTLGSSANKRHGQRHLEIRSARI